MDAGLAAAEAHPALAVPGHDSCNAHPIGLATVAPTRFECFDLMHEFQ